VKAWTTNSFAPPPNLQAIVGGDPRIVVWAKNKKEAFRILSEESFTRPCSRYEFDRWWHETGGVLEAICQRFAPLSQLWVIGDEGAKLLWKESS